MAVQFIIGPAGSGKSSYIMQTVSRQLQQAPRKKIILLVPEQATFTYQSALIHQHQRSGVLTLEILSFQRLARSVMQQVGGLACQTVNDLGKLLIVRRLLQKHTEAYPFLSKSVNRPGYLLHIGQAFQEMKRYQIHSDRLEQTIRKQPLSHTQFTTKLQELSQLYTAYEAFLSQDYLDSEDILDRLCQQLEQHTLFQDTDIWVDEFYDFTPQEYAILAALMKQAANVYVALPADLDNQTPGRQAAFHNTTKTLHRLRQLVSQLQVPVLPDKILVSVRWQQAEDLAFLEQHFFSIAAPSYAQQPQRLALWQGQNRMSEVDAVARKIRQLCREQGYHYSDIGIFTRSDQYELLLETVLTDYDIPYFVDHKETARQHPLTELLLAVFEIFRTNWNYQSLFRFLKTELLPLERHALDLLENYVLQYGIRGSAWYQDKDWQYGQLPEEDLTMLNTMRRQIAEPLRWLQRSLEQPQSVDQIIVALYHFLEDIGVPERLEQLCQEAVEQGLLDIAQVHQQIWEHLIQIFDQMSQILQQTLLSAEEFAVLLQSAFDHLDLGLLPNSLDQVFIGAIAHSRSLGLKAVFVLGLNEGIFPAKGGQQGFFNEYEKQELRDMGLELSPDSQEQLYGEQFLVYLALTRASQRLYLSYSLSDDEGKALRPSSVVDKLKKCYPKLREVAVQWPPGEAQDILPYLNHPGKTMGLLGSHLSQPLTAEQQALWAEVYNWFLQNQTPLFETVQRSFRHEALQMQCSLNSTQIYGTPMHLSVSALERYRQCPYSYFLTYGLRLQPRSLYKMEAVDVGQFYHAAIEQFSNYLLEQHISWQSLDAAQTKQIMAMIVDQLAPAMQNQILLSSGRYRYLRHRLQKTLERSALFLMEHGKKGDFVPVALEADFGTSQSKLSRWEITLRDGTKVVLQGRIDRIEQASHGQSHYLRVIDFKSGTQGLHLIDIYYGLKLQLLTYLQVAMTYYQAQISPDEAVLPAGVLYYFFRSGILGTDGPISADEAAQLHLANMKADGLLVADMHALQLAERDISTGGSTLLPVSLLTKAAPYLEDPDGFNQLDEPLDFFRKNNYAVVTKTQLAFLMHHTRQMISALAEEIHAGRIAVRPCQLKQAISCQYCSYQAICQIQTVDWQNAVETLPVLSRDEIWKRLEQQSQKGGCEV